MDKIQKIFLVSSIVVLVLINYAIFEKEQLKKVGKTVLLELAPVDPRSLMQGDYMRLRYAIEREITSSPIDIPKKGYLVVTLDEKEVAHFKRFYQDEPLTEGEKLFHYEQAYPNGPIEVTPHSFFFQEGHAEYYQTAKYGEFKFDDQGHALLIGLRDDQLVRIDPEKMSKATQ